MKVVIRAVSSLESYLPKLNQNSENDVGRGELEYIGKGFVLA